MSLICRNNWAILLYMSNFKKLTAYNLSGNDRILLVNGPELGEIFRWKYVCEKTNPFLFKHTSHFSDRMAKGPMIFMENHTPMVFTAEELGMMLSWSEEDDSETELKTLVKEVIQKAINKEERLLPEAN